MGHVEQPTDLGKRLANPLLSVRKRMLTYHFDGTFYFT